MSLILTIFLSAILALLIVLIIRNIYTRYKEQQAVERMCKLIFPEGNAQKETTIDDIVSLTKGRFNRDDLLDYYLKIKGLQILDLHTSGDRYISTYLMKPTKIRLNYYEQVLFYERYLNLPQAEGINAVE